MKAKVNKDTCIGCGLCADICPAVFKMNDEGIAIVIVDEIPDAELANAKDAKDQCASEAITIE
jgi:ferredoxin